MTVSCWIAGDPAQASRLLARLLAFWLVALPALRTAASAYVLWHGEDWFTLPSISLYAVRCEAQWSALTLSLGWQAQAALPLAGTAALTQPPRRAWPACNIETAVQSNEPPTIPLLKPSKGLAVARH